MLACYLLALIFLLKPRFSVSVFAVTTALLGLYEVVYLLFPDIFPALIAGARNAPWELFWGNRNWMSQVLALTLCLGLLPGLRPHEGSKRALSLTLSAVLLAMILPVVLAGSVSVLLGLTVGLWWWWLSTLDRDTAQPLKWVTPLLIYLPGFEIIHWIKHNAPTMFESLEVRADLYKRTLSLIADHPWALPSTFADTLNTYRLGSVGTRITYSHPDSDWLWLVATQGWALGGLAILVLVFLLYLLQRSGRLSDTLLASLLFFELSFQHPLGSPWVWLLTGVYLTLRFEIRPPRWLAVPVLCAGLIHAYPLTVITPFRTVDHHTHRLCRWGSAKACRLTRDWKSELEATPYSHHALKMGALHTSSCLMAFLHDSMKAHAMFTRTGCYKRITRDRDEWMVGYTVLEEGL